MIPPRRKLQKTEPIGKYPSLYRIYKEDKEDSYYELIKKLIYTYFGGWIIKFF